MRCAFLLLACVFFYAPYSHAEEKTDPAKPTTEQKDSPYVDFSSDETFLDVPDALRSKNYVSRAVLSSAIKATSHFEFGRMYLSNLIGYDAIFQPANRGAFAKYSSGDISFGGGYVSQNGHAFELALSLSAVSTISLCYRYIIHPKSFGLWPYLGLGLGAEIKQLSFSDVPAAAQVYTGSSEMVFPTLGVMIPLIDVGLKLEARFIFFGLSRLVLTTGAGVVFFL